MHHFPTLQTIPFDHIDLSEKWSLHPYLSSELPASLVSSVQSMGVLHPPIVQKQKENSYRLICGRLRLQALLKRRSSNSIPVLLLEEGLPIKRILHYILLDQALSGPLNPVEKASFFSICNRYANLDTAANLFFSVLEEKIQLHTIKRLLLLLQLEPEIQNSIHNGHIGEKVALELQQLSLDDRTILYKIFQDLELGNGKQKRLLTLTKELALGQGKTISVLLEEPDYSNILNHLEMNRPQKATTLLTALQKNLSPESNKAEEEFQKKILTMNLPKSCSISHSQAFERDEVQLRVCFNTLEDIEDRLGEIKLLAKKRKGEKL